MRHSPFNRSVLLAVCSAASLIVTVPAARAATLTVPIVNDTFIDSGATSVYVNGVDEGSYGADASIKVVASNTQDSFTNSTASYTHTLFQIPATVFAAYASGAVSDVTVSIYAKNDSLPSPTGTYPGNVGDGDDGIELHPLTQAFTVGNGTQSPMPPVASTTGGATWATYDGTHAWATAGGDYDSTYVLDTNTALPARNQAFVWDITPLLANPTTNAELAANGALLRLPDSISQVPVGTQDFTSLYSANNTTYTPFLSLTLVPEPASASLLAVAGLLTLKNRRRGNI